MTKKANVPEDLIILRDRWYDKHNDFGVKLTNRAGTVNAGDQEKIGKYSPGTHIPVVSIDYFKKNYPDIALLCSWNHKDEIFKKEKEFKKNGGKWISHVK